MPSSLLHIKSKAREECCSYPGSSPSHFKTLSLNQKSTSLILFCYSSKTSWLLTAKRATCETCQLLVSSCQELCHLSSHWRSASYKNLDCAGLASPRNSDGARVMFLLWRLYRNPVTTPWIFQLSFSFCLFRFYLFSHFKFVIFLCWCLWSYIPKITLPPALPDNLVCKLNRDVKGYGVNYTSHLWSSVGWCPWHDWYCTCTPFTGLSS